MHFIEVLERRWQLRQHRPGIVQIHATDVVPLERVDEALGHAVALRTADGRGDRRQAKRPGDASCVMRDVGWPSWRYISGVSQSSAGGS